MGDGGREEGMSMGKGLTSMGGVAEGPQQEAWGRGVVEARGAAIGHRRRIWLREIGQVRKVLGAAVEDFCGDF